MTPAGGHDRRPRRLLITGGGTGGHVYPGLAVAEKIAELAPGAEIRFAGTAAGIESVLVPRAGHRFHRVPASGFRGMGLAARLRFLVNFLAGWLRSLVLLAGWRPNAVLGTGGYVSAPVMAAARTLGIRCALQEQNAVPGSTNRLAGRWARRIYLGFGSAASYFDRSRCLETGNPVRGAFLAPDPEAALRGADRKRVLIFGGSRGAATLNAAVADAAGIWSRREDLALMIQTGAGRIEEVAGAYAQADPERIRIVPYIESMPAALAWADLVVCRAGAMTLAELHCAGKPAILVPFPFATDDHQMKNARDCERAGAARVLPDERCDGRTLVAMVGDLLSEPAELAAMARRARALARPDAAEVIARDLIALMGGDPAAAKDVDVP